MEDRKLELLKKLEKSFEDDPDIEEVSLFTKEELNAPMDVLRMLVTDYGPGLIDVLAEFSFIPFEGEAEVWYFSSVVTIKNNIPKDAVSALAGAAARLNFFLPYGSFGINPSGDTLAFKNVTLIKTADPDKNVLESMELAVDRALFIPEGYSELLIGVAEGRVLLSDFIDSLPE